MAEVIWSGEVHTWLLRIHDYISQDDAEAADQLINDIYAYAQQLAKFPKLGYRYRNLTDPQIRILLRGRYRIAYVIQPDTNIYILGVFHAGLNLERLI